MVTTLHTQLDLVRDYVNTLDFETGIDTIASPDELATWSAGADLDTVVDLLAWEERAQQEQHRTQHPRTLGDLRKHA